MVDIPHETAETGPDTTSVEEMAMTRKGRDEVAFDSVETAIETAKRGELIVVIDDTERENEGDLFVPAGMANAGHINFMTRCARGLVCVPMTTARLDELSLGAMVPPAENTESMGTAFTISVDAATTDTGISAHDRADTVKTLVDPETVPEDLERPGHIFPLEAAEDGLFEREGHTEAAVDLARLAGFTPAGVICEIMAEDGSMARRPELLSFAEEHDLLLVTVEDILEYRRRNERDGRNRSGERIPRGESSPEDLTRDAETVLPTEYGRFDLYAYGNDGDTHIVLSNLESGMPGGERPVVRVHSACLTGDALGSLRCDCGFQLARALEMIGERGGVLLYLAQEGRDIGLGAKLKAYELQDGEYDTVEANEMLGFAPDERRFGVAARILQDLGIERLTLLTNNPRKVTDLERHGLDVDRRAINTRCTEENAGYLETKRRKLGHRFDDGDFQ